MGGAVGDMGEVVLVAVGDPELAGLAVGNGADIEEGEGGWQRGGSAVGRETEDAESSADPVLAGGIGEEVDGMGGGLRAEGEEPGLVVANEDEALLVAGKEIAAGCEEETTEVVFGMDVCGAGRDLEQGAGDIERAEALALRGEIDETGSADGSEEASVREGEDIVVTFDSGAERLPGSAVGMEAQELLFGDGDEVAGCIAEDLLDGEVGGPVADAIGEGDFPETAAIGADPEVATGIFR